MNNLQDSPLRKVYDSKSAHKGRKNLSGIIKTELFKATEGKGVKVVIIDTGVDLEHEEIKHAIKFHINMFEKSDDVTDHNGHGTHVAGLIAGKTVGIAPEAELYISKSLDENGVGTTASVMDGITMAINIGADIICMSLGSQYETADIIKDRIQQASDAGIIIVSATGNEGLEMIDYPARLPSVLAVGGAMDNGDQNIYSNCGYEMDIIAPCEDIFSSYKDGKYATITGTSMATAITVGGLALVISALKQVPASKRNKNFVKKEIMSTIRHRHEKHTYQKGYGMLDISRF